MTEEMKALVPVEQRQVEFYGDEIVAVRADSGEVYVPLRQICDFLGVDWSGQRQRIARDPVLAEEVQPCVVVTPTQGQPDQRRELLALPLDFLPGWLFGINANRVKPEIRDRLITYQRHAYRVLAEAFQEGRLTIDPSFDELMEADTPAVQTYRMLQAMTRIARQQVLMEARLSGRLDDHEQRLESLEATLGDPGRYVTPEQASEISQAVKAVAMKLSARTGRNEYGGVYGELYRRFGITSYKQLPASRFQEAMGWLTEWHGSLAGDVPF